MANSKALKVLRKVVEGEHMAANALAVAASKAKEGDLQNLLSELSGRHEANAELAGSKIKALGGKYPVPGLRDQLKKGWEGVATSKTSKEAVKVLQKKEREAIDTYQSTLKKIKDERVTSLVLRNMADTSDHVVALGEKLTQLQGKKKGGRFLGLPRILWLAAAGAGVFVFVRRQQQSQAPASPSAPATPAGDSTKS